MRALRPGPAVAALALLLAAAAPLPPPAAAAAFPCAPGARSTTACGAAFAAAAGAGALVPAAGAAACATCAAGAGACSCPAADCLSVVSACREAAPSNLVVYKVGFGGCKYFKTDLNARDTRIQWVAFQGVDEKLKAFVNHGACSRWPGRS
jgi:hypothetical protein